MVISGPREKTESYRQGVVQLTSMRLCSNVPGQSIIQTALGGYQSADELLQPGGRIYEQREFVCQAIEQIPGLSAVRPDAAFYIFPKIDRNYYNIDNDEQFAFELLRQQKVLVTAGTGFNWQEPDHFRIVMLPEPKILADAMKRMGDFLKNYKQT